MMSRSMDMQQLAALAAKGSSDAKMLLNMKRHGVQNQDEQVCPTQPDITCTVLATAQAA